MHLSIERNGLPSFLVMGAKYVVFNSRDAPDPKCLVMVYEMKYHSNIQSVLWRSYRYV